MSLIPVPDAYNLWDRNKMKQCLCFSFFNSNRCSFGVVSMSSGISFPLCPLYCLGDCVFALG